MTKELEQNRITEIRTLHSEIGGYLKMTLDKAIRIGELLAEQKAGVKHGEWIPWIKENLPFSERSCRNYLRLYDHREELKTANVADLNEARDLLTIPLTPKERARLILDSRKLPPTERITVIATELGLDEKKMNEFVEIRIAATEQGVEIRKAAAAERAAEKTEKAEEKERKQRPVWVKEYLEANKEYKNVLQQAINRKKAGVFAPEDIQFIVTRHGQTIELMKELDETDRIAKEWNADNIITGKTRAEAGQ